MVIAVAAVVIQLCRTITHGLFLNFLLKMDEGKDVQLTFMILMELSVASRWRYARWTKGPRFVATIGGILWSGNASLPVTLTRLETLFFIWVLA